MSLLCAGIVSGTGDSASNKTKPLFPRTPTSENMLTQWGEEKVGGMMATEWLVVKRWKVVGVLSFRGRDHRETSSLGERTIWTREFPGYIGWIEVPGTLEIGLSCRDESL